MEEVVPEASLSPNGVPWLYALFSMLFVFFLFVMFSPFLLEIDQHVKKFLLKCRFTLHNIVHKDKENDDMKIDHLGRPGEHPLPFTFGRSNQSILKEINPGCSLEGLMLKLKFQYFGHLMRRVDSLEKTLMLGGVGGGRRRG
uniref:Transmembrane protein n=1 Tax=Moschus moschiferus TaxID=68415 RepID=A0A8C6FXE7_MOSMO